MRSRPIDRQSPLERVLAEQAQQSPRPRRGNRLALALGAATGLVLCLLALAVVLIVNGRSSAPDAAAQSLCADLSAQDYASMYTMLVPKLQAEGTQAQFAASQKELDTIRGKVAACSYTTNQADGSQAAMTFQLTRHSGSSRGYVHFIYVNGTWKVDNYDTNTI